MRVMFEVTDPDERKHTMTERKGKGEGIAVKAVLARDDAFLRTVVKTALQEFLEAEMTEVVGAGKSERTANRLGYRSGYYGRTLITRVGKLELRVPQDRDGRFSTELFERYQRSGGRWWRLWRRCTCKGCRRGRSRRSPRSCAATAFRPRRSAPSTRSWTRAWRNSPRAGWARRFPT